MIALQFLQCRDHLVAPSQTCSPGICTELTTAEIAEKMFVSPRTVDFHRNNLLLKTGAKNAAGLVVYAMTKGFYTP